MSVLQEQRDPLQNYAVSLSLYETASQTQKVSEGYLFNLHGGEVEQISKYEYEYHSHYQSAHSVVI
jgi:hypothetical protein